MAQIFKLNDKEEKAYNDFCEKHMHRDVNFGAIGGNISVEFMITSIGAFPSVKCSHCGAEENITDYDSI